MGSLNRAMQLIRSQIDHFSDFGIYANNTTTSLHNDYVYKFALPFERIDDPVGSTLLLQKYWYHSMTISFVYFVTVKLLQRFMRHREPFQLNRPLFFWNASLAIFSIIGFIRSVEDTIYSLYYLGLFPSMCYTIHPYGVAAFWALLFAISKIVELGDTYFIVLRKRPLTFLHCYHHIVVIIGAAYGGASHAAHGRFFVTMNYFVHGIMYAYYACASYGLHPSRCQQSMGNIYVGYLIYGSFALLFIKFYINAYFLRPKQRFKQKKIE
ncbi:Putative fatty acid elongation protein 4 [Toxocara canis]|uniref:Elongation of very long chain fatty acids protein n=1 Tax=Toxocara canis TaxID=6265 RepID=A0A0B2UZ67_TOXCA|nr:Putative fatty acid elongation protein 4 [Toxocara canis]